MSDEPNLPDFAGVLYIRSLTTGKLVRYNVRFEAEEAVDGDGGPDTTWRFKVVTTSPLVWVKTAADVDPK